MVKFEFELSDVNAENLFGCIDKEIYACKITISESLVKDSYTQWYENRIEYLSVLKTKLHNTKV